MQYPLTDTRRAVVLDLLAELVGDRPRIAAEEPVGHEWAPVTRLRLDLRAQGVGVLVISHDLPSILHVPDEVHLLHEGRIHLAGPSRAFVESADPVVRRFIDGRADGPLPVW